MRLDREDDYRPALSAAAQVLRLGKAIYINPEGTRSKTGEIQPFKVGVGVLAVETGAPIVPVLIEGTFKVLRQGSIIPRPHDLKVTFGRPISMDEYQKRKGTEMAFNIYKDVTDELFKRVLSLKVG
jgi:1-acyl-sn-glycerol-3-phosphate acyltransferase